MTENGRCRICGNAKENKMYYVRERMINRGEIFSYMQCSSCGCLQLYENIKDMSRYYNDYIVFSDKKELPENILYNFTNKIKSFFILSRKFHTRHKFRKNSPLSCLECLENTGINRNKSRILDIGCGNGTWLQELHNMGFRNLNGVDKYAPQSSMRYHFLRGEIFDISKQKFDLITLHHSFEHMENPELVLKKIYELLEDDGTCIIRIPVMGCEAWKMYGQYWYQIDAPRHYFLYTPKALNIICRKAGLRICRVKYDSFWGQFYVSEMYKKTDKSFAEICKMHVSDNKMHRYQLMAQEANQRRTGDQAIFIIKKARILI